jgi:hypothetical protein
MYLASKSKGEDQVADMFAKISVISASFFMLIVVIGNFFIQNLFIGVIIAKFNREQELFGKNLMLTDA